MASAGLPFVYAAWIKSNERDDELADRCNALLKDPGWQPRFCLVLHSDRGHSEEQLARSRTSIERQIYQHWTMAETSPELPADVHGEADFVVMLRIGDQLSPGALLHFAEAARANSSASILYGDEDSIDERGRRRSPWFKPQWNSELFFALDYMSTCAAIRASLAKRIMADEQPRSVSAILLAATSKSEGPIIHVPHIVFHVDGARTQQTKRVAEVAAHLKSLGAACSPGPFDTVRVQWPLPDPAPLVTVIVATRDRLELLRPCIESVLNRTDYANFELLVVDNASIEDATKAYLAEIGNYPKVRVIAYPQAFNFSAINNFAAKQAQGSFLCLLNNDTEVVEPAWLTELMRYAARRDVGAAGAKLLYDDGSIQHAGVVVGIGGAAGHAHRFLPRDEAGYFSMPHAAHFVSAVTAACLVVEKRKFDQVGGFDEQHLAVAFNDVDLCLKLQRAGWHNVYVPHAVLLHHESKSRGNDLSSTNIARYRRELATLQERWGTKNFQDPLHSPNLDRNTETFVIGL